MSSVNGILTHIITGRFLTERTRADHLARVLSEVEDLVREMRPTADEVVIEGGNTADLADLAEMRCILDGADWPPTPLGLSEVLKRADEADELDRRHAEALATISDLRSEVKRLGQTMEAEHAEHERVKREQGRLWLEAQDSIGQRQRDNAALRAQIAALTPGPWRTVAEEAPPRGEWIVVVMADGCAYTAQLSENQPLDWMRCWRRLAAGLLDVPAPAVTP
jgi:hypothetical protein